MLVFLSELTLPLSERTRTRSSSPSSLLHSSHGDGLCEEGSDQVFVLGTQDLGEVVVSPDRKSANTDAEKEDSDLALEMKDYRCRGRRRTRILVCWLCFKVTFDGWTVAEEVQPGAGPRPELVFAYRG
ncbi:unnamed protein product [Urochloa humidicola]